MWSAVPVVDGAPCGAGPAREGARGPRRIPGRPGGRPARCSDRSRGGRQRSPVVRTAPGREPGHGARPEPCAPPRHGRQRVEYSGGPGAMQVRAAGRGRPGRAVPGCRAVGGGSGRGSLRPGVSASPSPARRRREPATRSGGIPGRGSRRTPRARREGSKDSRSASGRVTGGGRTPGGGLRRARCRGRRRPEPPGARHAPRGGPVA